MTQHWKDARRPAEREAAEYEHNADGKRLGHLTYVKGKPVEGLCYCDINRAHDVGQDLLQ